MGAGLLSLALQPHLGGARFLGLGFLVSAVSGSHLVKTGSGKGIGRVMQVDGTIDAFVKCKLMTEAASFLVK